MVIRATSVNPVLLIWARQRAGLTIEEVAERIDKRPEDIIAWESGTAWPTYRQLETLAESIYRRPIALFFFPEPPQEAPPQQEFRTLPDFDVESLSDDTRFAVRIGRAHQQSLRELTGSVNPAERHLLRDFRIDTEDPVILARSLRDYLGISLEEQMSWQDSSRALANWRDAIEAVGIFVFKRSFKQTEISGFCLLDDIFPIIMINNSTSFNRQIFTLFHEVAHLLHGISSITTVDLSFIDRMGGLNKSLEVSCNKLAGEFLVPSDSFPWQSVDQRNIARSVQELAFRYKASREVILRRLLDRGMIEQTLYNDMVRAWAGEAARDGEGSGGNYYRTQITYLGRGFLNLAFSRYRAGVISIAELAEHLGVKAKNIPKLEEKIYNRS